MDISESNLAVLAFIIGAFLAAVANYLADRWGWTPRYRSPWRRFPRDNSSTRYPQRAFYDYLPIIGWLTLARFSFVRSSKATRVAGDYSAISGWESRFFWVRGFLVELLFALLIAFRCLYWRETYNLPVWYVETAFFWFLLVAALIDLDDYIIPDVVTITATLVALAVACVASQCVLLEPTFFPYDKFSTRVEHSFTLWTSTLAYKRFGASPSFASQAFILPLVAIWTFWCFALLDRRFYPRLGLRRAFALFFRRLFCSRLTLYVAVIWALGLAALLTIGRFPLPFPTSLDSLALAFIGLFFGVLLIWIVRIVGGMALGKEAMGFGDVILGGVIGAFLGWQGVLVVFFLAPFLGLVFGIIRRGFQAEREIPYGPFLALASAAYLIWREKFDEVLRPLFHDLALLAVLGFGGLILFIVLLALIRIVKEIRYRNER